MSFSFLSGQSDPWLQSLLDATREQFEGDLKRSLLALAETLEDLDHLVATTSPDGESTWQQRLRVLRDKVQSRVHDLHMERIATVGEQVDPAVHHVQATIECDDPPGTIVREIQAGYRFGDQLLRPAQVISAR
jgi:molecular chaperone GrpE (heat shock protein)